MSFFRSGRGRSRSRSTSRTYKYKHKIYEYDPSSCSSTEDDDLYIRRGRSRSGYRKSSSRSGSRSANFVANLGDNHFHHRGRSSDPPVIVYGSDNFGWSDYNYPMGGGGGGRCAIYCTCDDIHGHSHHSHNHSHHGHSLKKDREKLAEIEKKIQNCEKDKEEKRIKDIEAQVKKLAESRERYKLYNVPRSLQDIDLELAGCNGTMEAMKTIQYRTGGGGVLSSASGSCSCSRSCSTSRSRSRSRWVFLWDVCSCFTLYVTNTCSRSCGGHFQQQQQQQQQGFFLWLILWKDFECCVRQKIEMIKCPRMNEGMDWLLECLLWYFFPWMHLVRCWGRKVQYMYCVGYFVPCCVMGVLYAKVNDNSTFMQNSSAYTMNVMCHESIIFFNKVVHKRHLNVQWFHRASRAVINNRNLADR